MTDNTLNLDALTEAFKADCKVIRLKYEYPGYTGTEKYAIISDLSYEQIVEKHAPVVKPYIPFLLLSKAAGEVIAEFKRNEDKFFKRMQRDDSYGFEDGTTELYNAGICVPDFTGELFEEEKDSRIVWAAFARLTPTQKKYRQFAYLLMQQNLPRSVTGFLIFTILPPSGPFCKGLGGVFLDLREM